MIQIDLKVLLLLVSCGVFAWGAVLTMRRLLIERRIQQKRAAFQAEEKQREDALYREMARAAVAEAERLIAEKKR